MEEKPTFKEYDFNFTKFKIEKLGKKGYRIILLIIIGIWLLSGVYTVGPDEQGVVRRFGKMVRIVSPGINFHIPYPFEKVDTPKVTEVKRIEIGFRTIDQGPPARYRQIMDESLMLTGDENIVDCDLIVQYKIKDASNFLFNVKEIEKTVRNASEAALRQIIGKHKIDEALTTGKYEIQEETKVLLQDVLDIYESGLLVVNVQLQDVHPPEEVVDAFKDVASAKEDKNKLINEAEGYRNNVIPKSRGEAEQIIRNAEAYKEERIKRAQGDAQKFMEILQEYQSAKDVTEKRLYIETMEKILPEMEKYIIQIDEYGNLFNVLPLQQNK